MEGIDGGIGAMTFRFRSERVNQNSREQSADRHDEHNHPWRKQCRVDFDTGGLANGFSGEIVGEMG